MNFVDKVVIITGASSGIGAATAVLFSKEGANVTIVGRNESKLNKTASLCQNIGKTPLVLIADVSKHEDAIRIIETTIEKFGQIDILVNNAGFTSESSILGGNLLEAYDDIFNTNVRAILDLTSLAVPYLKITKGNIVNISSVVSMKPTPSALAYSLSKATLDHFTKGAAIELASLGIRVNSINPGPVKTDILKKSGKDNDETWNHIKNFTLLKRVSEPEEIAELIIFVAKAHGITGSIILCDNGVVHKM